MVDLHRSLLMQASRDSSTDTLCLDSRERSALYSSLPANLYDIKTNPDELAARPWKKLARFFENARISTLALTKMNMHAKLGGSIEVMGMLTGKIVGTSIVVCDVYPLPVEGTETRVNAQNEAYEYMVQYLDLLKMVQREEHIVGWYHLHPGYGCWLSGIDVATQSLNQNFQDPYLAIVVDPIRTIRQRKVDIGAFRAFPPGHASSKKLIRSPSHVAKSKRQDYGMHADQFYLLNISFYHAVYDLKFIDTILDKSWVSKLLESIEGKNDYHRRFVSKVQELLKLFQEPILIESKEWRRMHELCEEFISRTLEPSSNASDSDSLQAILETGDEEDEEDEEDVEDEDVDDDNEEENDEKIEEKMREEEMRTEMEIGKFKLTGIEKTREGEGTVGHDDDEEMSGSGKKRVFRASSTESRSSAIQGLLRKRFAASEGALSQQLIQKMSATQAELNAWRDMTKNVGKAEFKSFLAAKVQRQVFGGL